MRLLVPKITMVTGTDEKGQMMAAGAGVSLDRIQCLPLTRERV